MFVTGYRYIHVAHLYCLAVQAGFYSDVVECLLSTRENLLRSPSGKKEIFFACYIWRPTWGYPMTRAVIPRVCFYDKLYGQGLRGRSPIWWGRMSHGIRSRVEFSIEKSEGSCIYRHAGIDYIALWDSLLLFREVFAS